MCNIKLKTSIVIENRKEKEMIISTRFVYEKLT